MILFFGSGTMCDQKPLKVFGSRVELIYGLDLFRILISKFCSDTVASGVWSPSTISNACQLPGFCEERGIGILSTRRRPEGPC
jgi:hypothetical protein